MGAWLRGLIERRGKEKAIVALATNKFGRIVWRIIATDCKYDVNRAFKSM